MKKTLLALGISLILVFFAGSGLAALQKSEKSKDQPETRELSERGERAFGIIASVGVDRFGIKKMDGAEQTVMVDDKTSFLREQENIQFEDLKPGDRVFVRGRTNDNKELVAAVVRVVTDQEMAHFQNAGERAFGEIESIDGDKLKVRNPRQGEKIIVVNDQTTVMKNGEPIALKDLKVGDRIFALGKETGGKFVATRIMIAPFEPGGAGGDRGQRGRGNAPQQQ